MNLKISAKVKVCDFGQILKMTKVLNYVPFEGFDKTS